MLQENVREIDKSVRALVAAVIRQAVLDLNAMHCPKKNRNKGMCQVPDEDVRKTAKDFLLSEDTLQCALSLGISVSKYRELVTVKC